MPKPEKAFGGARALESVSQRDFIRHAQEREYARQRGKSCLNARFDHGFPPDHGRGLDRFSDHWPRVAGAAAACASGPWSQHLRGRSRLRQSVCGLACLAGVVGPLRRQPRGQARGRCRFADGSGGRTALSLLARLRRRALDICHDTAFRPRPARCGRELHHHGCGQLGTGSRRSTTCPTGWAGSGSRWSAC